MFSCPQAYTIYTLTICRLQSLSSVFPKSYSGIHSLKSATILVLTAPSDLEYFLSFSTVFCLISMKREEVSVDQNRQEDLSKLHPQHEGKFKATAALQFTMHLLLKYF